MEELETTSESTPREAEIQPEAPPSVAAEEVHAEESQAAAAENAPAPDAHAAAEESQSAAADEASTPKAHAVPEESQSVSAGEAPTPEAPAVGEGPQTAPAEETAAVETPVPETPAVAEESLPEPDGDVPTPQTPAVAEEEAQSALAEEAPVPETLAAAEESQPVSEEEAQSAPADQPPVPEALTVAEESQAASEEEPPTPEAPAVAEESQPESGDESSPGGAQTVSIEEWIASGQPGVEEAPQPEALADAQLLAIIEACIYVAEEPLVPAQVAAALGQDLERVRAAIEQLVAEFERPEHGIAIREVAGGYQMATKAEHHEQVRNFVKSLKAPLKLSLPALETLAVIAYKQPVTGPEIMDIRGVQGGSVIKTLLDRRLITEAGRKNVIGKPILYKTTKEFLMQFGLKDLAELPSLKEFEEIRRMAMADNELPAEVPAAPAAPAAPEPAVAEPAASETQEP